jgi:DUF4097 and DUF4098 domain-containing protein YvlB
MAALFFLGAQLNAGDKQVIDKSFKAKGTVEIKTVSGDCTIEKGTSGAIKVTVEHNYPAKYFEAVFEEKGDTLVIKEKFHNEYRPGHWGKNRYSKWTVSLPQNTNIDFATASGDLKLEGMKSGVKIRTASGDIKVTNYKGDMSIKTASGDIKSQHTAGTLKIATASGDIKLKNTGAEFEIKTASGDVELKEVHFTGASEFKSASGDIELELARTSEYDLNIATVSGDIILDYNGNPVRGYFTFKGKKGNISSDVHFDGDESGRYSPFAEKYFKKGGSKPEIFVKTVSGDISFKQ